MLWDYVSIMGTDTDLNHKPISIDFYGYFAPRKSCDKEYSNNHKNVIRCLKKSDLKTCQKSPR